MKAKGARITCGISDKVLTKAHRLVSLKAGQRQDWLKSCPLEEVLAALKDWQFWARHVQLPPQGAWHTWVFLGGRGAGKTRAGAEWIKGLAEAGKCIALIGPSLHDVREVMIEGPSGLKSIAPPQCRPTYEISRRRLIWPNGAVAYAFSAEDPESLRGPQFHMAWADEFCAWRKAGETLALLRMGMRLGETPRLCVTTTPKPTRALRSLMAESKTVLTRSTTQDNAHNLSEGFLDGLHDLYGGTRLASQELMGLVVDDENQGLWRAKDIEACYTYRLERYDEVVVAVDPPIKSDGDACGIIVAARKGQKAYILEDGSVSGLSPLGWASQVVRLAKTYGAKHIVAEANQGGDMVRTTINLAGADIAVRLVHARLGKRARAEPVAALYEQGRIFHAPPNVAGRFSALDEELMAVGSFEKGNKSPDRADALVWAISDLLLSGRGEPRISCL